jgi:hypothetical protein
MAFWYSLRSFGIFFPFLYVCNKKNLATLFQSSNKKCFQTVQLFQTHFWQFYSIFGAVIEGLQLACNFVGPGANTTILSYNASAVKIYNVA